jgi:hypothetical protein
MGERFRKDAKSRSKGCMADFLWRKIRKAGDFAWKGWWCRPFMANR